MPLTDTALRNAKGSPKPYKLFDGRGLYVLVNPTGTKWWRFKYRWQGKEKLLSLGTYPEGSLANARERREAARRLIAAGTNPSDARRSSKAEGVTKAAITFERVAREWHTRKLSTWVHDHANRTLRRLELHIFPWLGDKPLTELTAADFLPHLRRVEQTGAVETAHRVLNICSQVMRYGVATGRLLIDPTRDLTGALAPAKIKHRAAVTDPKELGALLRAMDSFNGTFPVRSALLLAPLLFVRPGELRHARWADVDLPNAQWSFLSTKKKVQLIVPLATQVVAILTELKPLTGQSEYVFPSARTAQRPMSNAAVLAALRRIGFGKEEMTGHGFRATARTIMEEVLQIRPDIIEHQLTHVVRGPLGRAYTRTKFLPERREMMQQWADYLEALREPKVVSFDDRALQRSA
ncbi:MAG: Prophage integrase IntA [Nitrosomonadaceae bacterium]|nr:Prophage integrase IntA [Nitrosomonadaceae bacterium]